MVHCCKLPLFQIVKRCNWKWFCNGNCTLSLFAIANASFNLLRNSLCFVYLAIVRVLIYHYTPIHDINCIHFKFNNMITTNIGICSISHLKIRTNIDILAKAFVLFCHFPNSDSDSIPCHIAPAFLKVSCLSQRFAKASFYISYQNPWAEQTMSKL